MDEWPKTTREKFWKIWDMAQEDTQYRYLLIQLRAVVCEFVALCEAMSERMLEFACEQMEFPNQ